MPAEEKIKQLMNDHGTSIFRICFLYLKDYHLAEDAVQDTFIKAMNSWDSFQRESNEKTWLTRIAVNTCKNIMRTNWFRLSRNELLEDVQDFNDVYEAALEKNCISNAIMRLRAEDRKMILLYYYQELSMKEIAQIIRKNENTTIQRVNRARCRLRKILLEEGYDETFMEGED